MATEGRLKGKVALVTGGSRGIGKEISIALASDGAAVVVNYAGNDSAATETVGLITSTGAKAIAVKGDISKSADVIAAFDKAVQTFGAVNIVVHVAGIGLDNYPSIVDTTEAEWDRIFATNAKGTFLVTKEAAKRLGPGGRIITTSSSLTGFIRPGYGAYTATKAAVEVLTKTLAKELKGKRITVNCIAPGPVATEMFFQGKTQQVIDMMAKEPPLERLGEPKDIAAVIQFLASGESEWVNGQVIRINGGTV
ncbi:unnamed protein product [Calypogeia fissa]